MSQFDSVSVVKLANIYFDGGVTSRTLKFSNGETKTLGIIQPGEYEFNTDKKEIMDILQGNVSILIKDEENWRDINAGESFEVPAQSSFKIKTDGIADYCCSFVD